MINKHELEKQRKAAQILADNHLIYLVSTVYEFYCGRLLREEGIQTSENVSQRTEKKCRLYLIWAARNRFLATGTG